MTAPRHNPSGAPSELSGTSAASLGASPNLDDGHDQSDCDCDQCIDYAPVELAWGEVLERTVPAPVSSAAIKTRTGCLDYGDGTFGWARIGGGE